MATNQSKAMEKIINNPSCEIISLSEEHGIVQGKKIAWYWRTNRNNT